MTTVSSVSALPSGISPPLAVDVRNNHGGLLIIVASVAVFCILGSLVIRSFSLNRSTLVQKDECAFLAAVVCLKSS